MLIHLLQSRSIGNQRDFQTFQKLFQSKRNLESSKKPCLAPTPVVPNGPCRFCFGYLIKSEQILFQESCKLMSNR